MSNASELPIWAVDTEDDSKGKVKLINFYDGTEHHTFKTQKEAVHFLFNEIRRAQIWACNCEYDLTNIFGEEMLASFVEMTYLKSAFVKARVADVPGVRVVFYDTLRHWKLSVKGMGDKLGFKKLEFDPDSVEYCQRDTEIVHRWVMRQRQNYSSFGAGLRATIGSSALKLWQEQYPEFNPVLAAPFRDFCSDAVRGGRVEIFRMGVLHGKIDCYDINSMYPYVMKEMEYPDLDTVYTTERPDFSKYGCAEVSFVYPFTYIPSLPVKTEKLLFPVGRLRGVFCYPEIRQALQDGAQIEKIHRCVEFRGSVRPFRGFINDLYNRRKAETDEIAKDTFKLFMNNLFGKYGAKNGIELWRGFNVTERNTKSPEANQIWAAYVTSYARLHLLKTLRRYAPNVLYCDTDSVFLLNAEPLPVSNELGEWKHVGTYNTAHFVLPKVYMLMEGGARQFKIKGVPKKSAEEFYDKHEVAFESPIRFRESFKRGIKANVWIEKTRTLNQKYDKRIVVNETETEPIKLK